MDKQELRDTLEYRTRSEYQTNDLKAMIAALEDEEFLSKLGLTDEDTDIVEELHSDLVEEIEDVNTWVFNAITGGNDGSAPVSNWETMTREELKEEIETQVEEFGRCCTKGDLDVAAVIERIVAKQQS